MNRFSKDFFRGWLQMHWPLALEHAAAAVLVAARMARICCSMSTSSVVSRNTCRRPKGSSTSTIGDCIARRNGPATAPHLVSVASLLGLTPAPLVARFLTLLDAARVLLFPTPVHVQLLNLGIEVRLELGDGGDQRGFLIVRRDARRTGHLVAWVHNGDDGVFCKVPGVAAVAAKVARVLERQLRIVEEPYEVRWVRRLPQAPAFTDQPLAHVADARRVGQFVGGEARRCSAIAALKARAHLRPVRPSTTDVRVGAA